MVMDVVVVMVAPTAGGGCTTAASTAVREQTGGRRAWSCDQEGRSGHHGQKQSLAKHQRSPHLVKFLRRVNPEEHLLPREPRCGWRRGPGVFRKTRSVPQISRPAISVICDNYADAALSKCEDCGSFVDNRLQNNNARRVVKSKRPKIQGFPIPFGFSPNCPSYYEPCVGFRNRDRESRSFEVCFDRIFVHRNVRMRKLG
jgi:hypothetical protein